jgi:hypothetical protein
LADADEPFDRKTAMNVTPEPGPDGYQPDDYWRRLSWRRRTTRPADADPDARPAQFASGAEPTPPDAEQPGRHRAGDIEHRLGYRHHTVGLLHRPED